MQQIDETIKQIVKSWAAGLIVKKDSIQIHEKFVDEMIQMCGNDPNIVPTLIRMKNIVKLRKALSNGYATIFEKMSERINFSLGLLSDASEFFAEEKSYKKAKPIWIKKI